MAEFEKGLKILQTEMPGVIGALTKLNGEALKDGAISIKHKRLILTAITVALRSEPCFRKHISETFSAGATKEEVMEAIGLALLMTGGPGVSFCSTYIADALKDLEAGS